MPHSDPRTRSGSAVSRLLVLVLFLAAVGGQLVSPAPGAPAAAGANAGETQTISFGSRTVELTLDHSGNNEWAGRVSDIVVAGGPALEELIGVPYPGPEKMTISERTDEQLDGYAGTAGCSHVVCHIRLLPDFDDTTLLHELTHAWTQSFRNRWLAEGMAEYISDRASARIDGRSFPVTEPAADRPPFPLLDWMLTIDFATAEEQDIRSEYEGYYWSKRFFDQLEATIGPDALKRTMAAVVPLQSGTVGVRRFMDALDDAGAQADDLFTRYVFPPDREQEIRDRRASRDRLAALTARSAAEAPDLPQEVFVPVREQVAAWEFAPALAALDRLEMGLNAYLQLRDRLSAFNGEATAAGLAYPLSYQNAAASWAFAPILDTIDQAEAALNAYVAAETKVSAPRTLWQRIGLALKSPDGDLEEAGLAFAAGSFDESVAYSHSAEASLADAGSRAAVNVLIAGAVLLAIILGGAVFLLWAARSEPTPAQA